MGNTYLLKLFCSVMLCMAWVGGSSPAQGGGAKIDPSEHRAPVAPPDTATPIVPSSPEPPEAGESSFLDRAETRPVELELSPHAQDTFLFLLFTQAMLAENEADLLAAARLPGGRNIPPRTWLEGGVWLMRRNSAEILPYLVEALKIYPDDMSLNLLYAEALLAAGKPQDGEQVMRDFLKKFPDALDARRELALLLVKTRQFAEAESLLQSISPKQRTPRDNYYQARVLIGMGKNAEAIPYLQKAIRGIPDCIEGMTELAYIYEQQGNWREARNIYEQLARLGFSPQDVYLRLINLSLRLKQPERALQYIRQAPDSPSFRLAAAGLLLDSRHYLQAENLLKQLAAAKNPPSEVYLLLADLAYEHRKNLKQALSWLDRIGPDDKNALKADLLRAQLLADNGQEDEALAILNAGVRSKSDTPEIQELEIRILAKKKDYNAALAKARAAAARWPKNPEIIFLLGTLLDESGNKHEAFNTMEALLATDQDNYQALNYVGYTLAEENRDLQRAIALLTRANALAPNQAYIIDSLAWAYFRAGQLQDALREIRRAISLGEHQDAAIWEHYGDIAEKNGKKDEARRAYRRAMELKPANSASIRKKISQL